MFYKYVIFAALFAVAFGQAFIDTVPGTSFTTSLRAPGGVRFAPAYPYGGPTYLSSGRYSYGTPYPYAGLSL